MAYEVESYAPEQREDYLRLLRDAWGEAAIGADEFDWWFGGNPTGSLMSVARADGRVVGAASHSLLRVVLRGEEKIAAFSLHAVTDAAARGQGVFAAIERKNEADATARGAAIVISVPAESAARVFLGKLGWTSIDRLRVWARPLPRFLRPRRRAERLVRFEHGGDAAAAWTENHVVRDAEFLNWRYLASPRRYSAFRANGGYAVVGHKRQRGQPVAYVADLVADDARPLLRACLAAAAPEARAVLALPAREQRGAYAALGFVPTPLTLHFMGMGLNEPLDANPRAWRLALGDTDFF